MSRKISDWIAEARRLLYSLRVKLCILILCVAMACEAEPDPFENVAPRVSIDHTTQPGFFSENFGFRKELMSEFGITQDGFSASRQSAGFEVLKKFSTATKTFASFDFQGRLVRRDGFIGFPNDGEGMNRMGWAFEYHNVYADFYNVLDPVLSESGQSSHLGRFNLRVGRFYLPFGLNLQTDTHGTLLQLSNERNFGFERDWYAGFWGNLNEAFRYDLYYLAGSGYPLKFEGQSGLIGARLGLANKYSTEGGLEGGISFLVGERLASSSTRVNMLRGGLDFRYRHLLPNGTLTWMSELSGGRDGPDALLTQLYQVDYLPSSRRWGLATQFRWNWQEKVNSSDSSLLSEATWYFANDVSASNLHWVKLNCEVQLARQQGKKNVVWTLQYYRYW